MMQRLIQKRIFQTFDYNSQTTAECVKYYVNILQIYIIYPQKGTSRKRRLDFFSYITIISIYTSTIIYLLINIINIISILY